MKTKITKFNLMLAICLFALPISLFAAAPAPEIYICGAGTVTLKYSGAYVLQTGDQVVWQKVTYNAGTDDYAPAPGYSAVLKQYNGTASDTDLIVTGGSATDLLNAPGEHFWRAHVIASSPIVCTGDVSPAINIYVLPTFTLALNSPITNYCNTGTTNNTKATVTATVTPGSTLPTGVSDFDYDWSGSTTGAGAVDPTDSKSFLMSSTTAGDYTIQAVAKYKTTYNGKNVKSQTGTPCEETKTTVIKVTNAPTQPTITVS